MLLTLQASFLLPPVGYALMMTRGILAPSVPPARRQPRALAPFLAVQVLVLGLTLVVPRAGASAGAGKRSQQDHSDKPPDEKALENMLRGMPKPPLPKLFDSNRPRWWKGWAVPA